MSDFIDLFLSYSEGMTSPHLFRLWSGISLVAGALERRVWAKAGRHFSYPNLFVLLVAPPGVGKFIIEDVRNLWSEATVPGNLIPAFNVAPDSMTKASMIDHFAKASTTFLKTGGAPFKYNSLLVAQEEFSVLLPAYDMEYIGTLNAIWSNKAKHQETRRYGPARDIVLENPTLNIISGAQPGWLSALFPEEAWNTGLARRLVMIYSTDTPHRSLFYEPPENLGARKELLSRLGQFSQMYGQVKWEQEALEELDKWYMSGSPNMGGAPVPDHTKLQHYNRSRGYFSIKLSIISALSRSNEMIIRKEDIERALGWMLEAERFMPDVFRAMVGRSDKDVLDELHMYVYGRYVKGKNKPVAEEEIRRFLLERVPHEKVDSLLNAADKANLVQRIAGTNDWKPKARFNFSPE